MRYINIVLRILYKLVINTVLHQIGNIHIHVNTLSSSYNENLTSNQWFEFVCDRQTLPYGGINIVQKLRLWVGGVEIGGFTSVHHWAPSHSHKDIKLALSGKINGSFETEISTIIQLNKLIHVFKNWERERESFRTIAICTNRKMFSKTWILKTLFYSPFITGFHSTFIIHTIFQSCFFQGITDYLDWRQLNQTTVCHYTNVSTT